LCIFVANLSTKLEWLDLLLHREILRLRARYELSLDEFRGLYISDEHVNKLIDQQVNCEGETSVAEELTQRAELLRSTEAEQHDTTWRQLAVEFSLSTIEQDLLLLALAPELDLKYETLYGYLNNDVTRKWPTHDLALRLFASNAAEKVRVRCSLAPTSTLFRAGLLQPISSSLPHTSSLAHGFSITLDAVNYLLGFSDQVEVAKETRVLTPSQQSAVSSLVDLLSQGRNCPLIVFSGREGTGRSTAAGEVCRQLNMKLVRVDLAALRASPDFDKLLQSIFLQQRLYRTAIYLDRAETLFDEQERPLPESNHIIRSLAQSTSPTFIGCNSNTPWRDLLSGQRTVAFSFDEPDYLTRLQLWCAALAEHDVSVNENDLEELADRFELTPAQINFAAANAANRSADTVAALFDDARSQSDQRLGSLALKVRSIHTWEDLVLPASTLVRVKEFASAIKNRHIVYSEWGFERHISSGKGLKALFAGASGTGKTMSAGVIARELALDLYKIDLSGIVSKYIGETEKNLDRIFTAAKCSNSILFFDEADALFGKRSEIKDAHDRYANIEVAYLLQKIEDYEGVVILASNLSKNIDEAFSRRMHYVVEFPLPDEKYRERLWRNMFPRETPLSGDVDFQFLARKFPIAGGDIRNVALDAAFVAAQNGRVVTMSHLTRALARQMTKQGKIPSAMDFQQYYGLLVAG